MSDIIEIEILNWEKYNPRKDLKNTSWVRLQNDTWISESLFEFTIEEKWVWICLLCHASKKQTGKIEINLSWFSHYSGVSSEVIRNTIEKLTRNADVTCTLRVRDVDVPLRTNERTNERHIRASEKNEIKDLGAANASLSADAEVFMLIWNELVTEPLPKIRALSTKRKKAILARWREKPDQAYWREVISRINKSKFCRGGGSQNWIASFDFLLRPDTHLKVMEGQYDARATESIPKRVEI